MLNALNLETEGIVNNFHFHFCYIFGYELITVGSVEDLITIVGSQPMWNRGLRVTGINRTAEMGRTFQSQQGVEKGKPVAKI